MTQPGRKFTEGSGSGYRYGLNGQERSDELNENLTTALYWEYDSRIGRRWNLDPKLNEYESPYLCFSGNPINMVDPDGDETKDIIYQDKNKKEIGRTVTKDNFDQYIPVLQGTINPATSQTSSDYKQGAMTVVYHHRHDKDQAPTPATTPSQAPINTKQQPAPNNNPELISKPVQKVFDVAGATATTTQALSSGFLRAARLARLSGGVGTVPIGLPSGLNAKSFNVVTLGRVKAVTALKITNVAKVVDAVAKPIAVIGGVVSIVKDGKLTAGDAGVAALTAAQIAFPIFGAAVGVYDIGSLIFGYKSSSDLIHDVIDNNLPSHGWQFTGTKK